MTQSRNPLQSPKSALELLDRYYLDMRCNLLETAAAMDRLKSASGGEGIITDRRYQRLLAAIDILTSEEENKAARILDMMSDMEEKA